jgi:MFS family permease
VVLTIKMLMTTTAVLGTLGCALLVDRWGPVRMAMAGTISVIVLVFPFFTLVNTGSEILGGAALVVMLGLVHPLMYTPIAALLGGLFDTDARYTGVALSFQTASVIGAGLTPLIASGLLAAGGGGTHSHFISLFVIACCTVTAVGLRLVPSATDRELPNSLGEMRGAPVVSRTNR